MNPEQQLALQNLLWLQQQDPLFSSSPAALYPTLLMNAAGRTEAQEPQRFHPLSLFGEFTNQKSSGCLRVSSGSLIWLFYFDLGQLAFATHSVNPSGRLTRHLTQLSQQVPSLVSAVRAEVRSLFNASLSDQPNALPFDYQAIAWLVEQGYLNQDQATQLIQNLAKEVLESFLKLTEGTHDFLGKESLSSFPSLCQLNLRELVEECQTQLRQQVQPQPTRLQTTDIAIAPAITQFESPPQDPSAPHQPEERSSAPARKLHRVACIDDSPTVLNAINSFLDPEYFSIVLINDPLKALMQIIRSKPDLILLDIGMPNLDGYELCSLLRKHSNFKHTPIVMVTGNTGFIDRAKAKLVGASGYLTKPFTRAELMKMVFRYLT